MRFRMAYASVLGANEMMSRSSAGANQGVPTEASAMVAQVC